MNKQEFENMTFCYLEQMFRLAYSRLACREDAEDVVQETYLRAYRACASFRGQAQVKTWLTRILLNCIRDYQRKDTRTVATVELVEPLEEGEASVSEQGPEEQLCRDEIDPELMKALNAMPDILLIPLLLREVHDASYEEIAGILDIPRGTVMSRLFRARTLLRKSLSVAMPARQSAVENSEAISGGPTHDL